MTRAIETRLGPWMQTYSGRAFALLDPRAEDVDLGDIAHALSLICRYTGHTREHYSVAEHSVRVSWVCEGLAGLDCARMGLIHDAAEAYTGDLSAPMKAAIRETESKAWDWIEDRIESAVRRRFASCFDDDPDAYSPTTQQRWNLVKAADLILLATEARDLLGPPPQPWTTTANVEPLEARIEPWTAKAAETHFLARAAELGLR